MPESILHLVLRLRGGGWGIRISIPDGKILTIDGPPDHYPMLGVYGKVYAAYPQIKKSKVVLVDKNSKILDPKKTISDCGISHNNCEVYAAIPAYFFGTTGIVKLMRVAGYWDFDQEILNDLDLTDRFNLKLKEYGENQKKAMTAVMIHYLETEYPNEQEELKLVINKAQKYLKK
jgi:hypothetical protein